MISTCYCCSSHHLLERILDEAVVTIAVAAAQARTHSPSEFSYEGMHSVLNNNIARSHDLGHRLSFNAN